MQIFRNRPLALSACLLALCAVLTRPLSGTYKLVLLLLAAGALVVLLAVSLIRRRMGRGICLLSLCLGGVLLALASSYLFFNVRYAKVQALVETECTAEGVVTERMYSVSYGAQLAVRLDELNGESCRVGAILECEYASSLQVGDCFSVTAVPREFTKDELFDEANYHLADDCLLVMTVPASDACHYLGQAENDPLIWASKLNTRLSYGLRNAIGGEVGGVGAALLLGNRSWLSEDTVLAFRRAGVSHLLALSGLHVSILIGFLELVFRKLKLPHTARAVTVPLFALGYLALSGFAVSTWRAVLMICVLYLAYLFRADYDAFTALSLTLALILTVTPYAVLDLSLWMSFLAAGSIIVFSPAVSSFLWRWKRRTRLPAPLFRVLSAIASAFAVGALANLALLLLSASVFGEISLASIPATMLLSIPVTCLLVLSAISLLLPFLPILPWLCGVLGELVLEIASRCSEIERVLLPVNDLPTYLFLLILTAVLIIFAVARVKRPIWSLLIPIISAAAVCSSLCVPNLSTAQYRTALRAGKGEVRLYATRGDAVLINDTSGNASEAYEIKVAANDAHCTEIDDLVFCGYYNQATYFIASLAAKIRVERVHFPTPTDERERAIAARLAEEAELHGIEVFYDAEQYLRAYDEIEE